VGAGAIGSLYAARLHQPPRSLVSVVCRSNFHAVRTGGYRIQSSVFGDIHFVPHSVHSSAADAAACIAAERPHLAGYDHVVVTMKALPDLVDAAELISPAVTPGRTMIHLIQNGVGIEDPFVARFPTNPVSSCVTHVAATQVDDGRIIHKAIINTLIGLHHSVNPSDAGVHAPLFAPRSRRLQSDVVVCAQRADRPLAQAHVERLVQPAVHHLGLRRHAHAARSPRNHALVHDTMAEVQRAALAVLGVPFPESMETIDKFIAVTRGVGPYRPSMLADWDAGRPIEIEVILGNPIRIAAAHGVDTPILKTIYATLKSLNAQRSVRAAVPQKGH
ncbi:ketopantoate reductase PanE/ApbA-domain-containing protein, partial [Entophlyctis helioformis]